MTDFIELEMIPRKNREEAAAVARDYNNNDSVKYRSRTAAILEKEK